MAPPLQVAQASVVRLHYAVAGQLAICVYGALVTGNPTFDQAFANTLGAALKSNFLTNLASHMNSGSGLIRVSVRDIRQANLTEFFDTNPSQVGTGVGDSLPPQTAICITLRTAKSGKSFRGRSYIPGWLEADNAATGQQATTATSAALAYMTGIQTAFSNNGLNLAVLSRPADRQTLTRTTFHSDGTQETEILSETKAKTGSIERVTALESRTAGWETQRRRANSRGATPSLANASNLVTL